MTKCATGIRSVRQEMNWSRQLSSVTIQTKARGVSDPQMAFHGSIDCYRSTTSGLNLPIIRSHQLANVFKIGLRADEFPLCSL